MIITNNFVMLNLPKTGSVFAREVIKKAYSQSNIVKLLHKTHLTSPNLIELFTENLFENLQANRDKDQHGVMRQIPVLHQNKPIISITRNPFSRYVSGYTYQSWKNKTRFKSYPNFPKLSFLEFYEMKQAIDTKRFLQGITPKIELGFHTVQFIQFYFKNPIKVLKEIDQHYIDTEQFRHDMGKITFLRQENLKTELKDFLLNQGISQKKLAFLANQKPLNVSLKSADFWSYHNQTSIKKILSRDQLLFKIFPQYKTGIPQ